MLKKLTLYNFERIPAGVLCGNHIINVVRIQDMRESYKLPLEPFGQALLSYWRGNESAVLIHEFKTGKKNRCRFPYFSALMENFYRLTMLLIIAGVKFWFLGQELGVHALEPEKRGYEVTAIDICPQALHIMKERGIKDARQQNFLHFEGERFDTVFMLGHNIGICETLKGIKGLLRKCERLLRSDGQLLPSSVKEPESAIFPDRKGYPGEQEFRLSFEGNVGPWMHWLHVDFDTLAPHVLECGWSVEKLINTEEGGFLARLNPIL